MDENLKKFAQRLSDSWNSLDKKKKIIIPSVAAAVVIIIIMVVSALSTTKYELLCSGLTESEAGQIYSAVSAKSIPVKVSGTSIFVEKGTADTVLMQLAQEGLPEGNLTYDIYSSGSNFSETDKDKQIKQLQQTQNRLQSTIETISGVKQAIVNIAESSDDTYVLETDKTPTTASVKLSLQSGTTLTKSQVNGIVQLVAKSVSGLTAANITVADSDGTTLNDDTNNGTDETSDQLIMKSKYEASVKSKLVQMLGQVYGDSNVNVVVNADIDFSSVSTVTNSYTSGVANYVSEGSTVTVNGSSIAGGAAGVSGAQPTYANTSGSGTTNYSTTSTKTTSMLNGSVQQEIVKNGGKLNKLTVAVILNSHDAMVASANTGTLKQTVADAVGTTATNISIEQMGFSSASAPISSGGSTSGIPILAGSNVLYIIVASALLLIVLITLLLVLLKQRKKKREEKMQEALLAAQAQEAAKQPAEKEKRPIVPNKSIEETRAEAQNNSFKKEIEDFTDDKPELVAQILKNWLKD